MLQGLGVHAVVIVAAVWLAPPVATWPAGHALSLPAVVTVGPPEQLGGPTGSLYDSPFTATAIPGSGGPGARLIRGYSANSASRMVVEGPSLRDVLNSSRGIGLAGSPDNRSALDHCGDWLNVAIADPAAGGTEGARVRGFYHEEAGCDYARAFYTNKSIGFALSTDGGRHFTKHGVIISPPPGNTTTTHQTGEGDHGVAVVGDALYLYFREWDPPAWSRQTTVGLATSPTTAGGPGSWRKYHEGAFTEPGVGGRSSAIAGISGTSVHSLALPRCGASLVSVGNQQTWPPHSLAFSANGIDWAPMKAPLMPLDGYSWNRSSPAVGELHAYPSLVGAHAARSLGAAGEQTYLYYTYLEPGATFADRYLVRRPLSFSAGANDTASCGATRNTSRVLLALSGYVGDGDHWTTTALVPASRGYRPVALARGAGLRGRGVYTHTSQTSPLQRPLYDCYLAQWRDHMVASESEKDKGACSSVLRLLGWVYTTQSPPTTSPGEALLPLWRCFNNATKDHATGLTGNCSAEVGPGYANEFVLGYVSVPAPMDGVP